MQPSSFRPFSGLSVREPVRSAAWDLWLPSGLRYGATQASLGARPGCGQFRGKVQIEAEGECHGFAKPVLGAGTVFVMTSNYPPDGLYPNGLQRINFLPTIDMIKRRFDVVEVDHGTDYRLRSLEKMEAFLVPGDDAADKHLASDFAKIAGTPRAPSAMPNAK